MKIAIQLHLAGLSLSNTVSFLENFGVARCRSTVHSWAKKADFEPRDTREPTKIAMDETVVKIDGESHCLIGTVDPESNVILHVVVNPARTTVATILFLHELE